MAKKIMIYGEEAGGSSDLAAAVKIAPIEGMDAQNVQSAIEEVSDNLTSIGGAELLYSSSSASTGMDSITLAKALSNFREIYVDVSCIISGVDVTNCFNTIPIPILKLDTNRQFQTRVDYYRTSSNQLYASSFIIKYVDDTHLILNASTTLWAFGGVRIYGIK